MYAPRKIILNDECVIIRKGIGKIEIPYGAIKEVTLFAKPKLTRIFGSGGLFGYFGIYIAEGIGKVRVYAKRSWDFVLIRADRDYMIAPEKPDEFILNLKDRLKQR